MDRKKHEIVLDEYEKEILDAFENGRLKPSKIQTNKKHKD
jgi:hypothetical protein